MPRALAGGGGRRSNVAVARISVLLVTTTVAAGCGTSGTTSGDGDAATAVEVGEQLKAAGAPITRPIRDTTFESRWADYRGLTSDAETASKSLELAIEVYDTAANRRWAGKQQDKNLVKSAPYSTMKVECGVILVSGIGSKTGARAAAERREFKKIEKALVANFGPC